MAGRRVLGAGLIVGVALSACGSSGSSTSDFKKKFQAEKRQFQQLGRDIQSAGRNSKNDAQLAGAFASLASRTNQQATRLRNLNPPSKYKSQTNQLATDFDTVAADLTSISNAASQNNGNAARAGVSKLQQDAASLKSVDQSLSSSLGLPQNG